MQNFSLLLLNVSALIYRAPLSSGNERYINSCVGIYWCWPLFELREDPQGYSGI